MSRSAVTLRQPCSLLKVYVQVAYGWQAWLNLELLGKIPLLPPVVTKLERVATLAISPCILKWRPLPIGLEDS